MVTLTTTAKGKLAAELAVPGSATPQRPIGAPGFGAKPGPNHGSLQVQLVMRGTNCLGCLGTAGWTASLMVARAVYKRQEESGTAGGNLPLTVASANRKRLTA